MDFWQCHWRKRSTRVHNKHNNIDWLSTQASLRRRRLMPKVLEILTKHQAHLKPLFNSFGHFFCFHHFLHYQCYSHREVLWYLRFHFARPNNYAVPVDAMPIISNKTIVQSKNSSYLSSIFTLASVICDLLEKHKKIIQMIQRDLGERFFLLSSFHCSHMIHLTQIQCCVGDAICALHFFLIAFLRVC